MQKYSSNTASDVYSLVTNRIIELLEKGTIPWRKPWLPNGMPKNLISQRPYTGINTMLLNSLDFSKNYFLTWHQLQEIGGHIKRGEKGSFIVFQSKNEKEVQKNGEITIEKRSILRYYYVYNVEQCLNLPRKYTEVTKIPTEIIDKSCEKIVQGMPLCPTIYYRGNEAYYMPKHDYINMPKLDYFDSMASFYGVLFHELIHSTGALKRLARKSVCENTDYGNELYSLEELIAEIGSCYLTSIGGVGISNLQNSAAYIKGWLSVLENDKRFIVKAASKAQRAVEYILNIHHSKETGNRS